jgi:hypothetical protein
MIFYQPKRSALDERVWKTGHYRLNITALE